MTKRTLTNIADITYENSIEEFKSVITGFDSDNTNPLMSKLASSATGQSQKDLNSKDAKILNRLIGTISGGYFLKDMVNGSAFNDLPLSLDSISGFIGGLLGRNNEQEEETGSIYFYHESCKNIGGNLNPRVKKSVAKNGINKLFRVGTTDSDANVIPNKNTNPSIGAVEFKRHNLSLAKRYGDAISLFYNCIPHVDMSLCTPFLSVKLLIPENDSGLKSLSHGVQFRFDRYAKKEGLVSSAIQKLTAGGKSKNKNFNSETAYDEFGMELFLSPQTLTNSNIRKVDKNIIEPNNTLMTLKNCNIAIAGMGVGLFCSKNARLQIELHDRSRLRDIAPFISPEQFGKARVVLEYGWSHPQGGPSSSNTVGKFLNSLRDKGVFIVKGSSFSFQNGGMVDITVDMAMVGGKASSTASIAAGDYVQSSVFKNEIESVALEMMENAPENERKEVRKRQRVNIRNSKSVKGIMDRETFNNIKKIIDEEGNPKKAIKEFLTVFENLSETSQNAISEKLNKLRQLASTLTSNNPDDYFLKPKNPSVCSFLGVTENSEDATPFVSLGSVLMLFVAYPLLASYQFDEVQMFFYPLNQQSGGGFTHTTASFPVDLSSIIDIIEITTQDKQIFNNTSVSNFMSKLDSKVIRNPSNRHYGLSSEYQALSAAKSVTLDMISKVKAGAATDEEKSAVGSLGFNSDKLGYYSDINQSISEINASDRSAEEKAEAIKQISLGNDLGDVKSRIIEDINKKLDAQLKIIYENYDQPTKEKDSMSYTGDMTFTLPNLSYYFETITPYSGDNGLSIKNIGRSILESNQKSNEQKTILRIHVYDEESVANKTQQLMLNLSNSKEIVRAVDKSKIDVVSSIKNIFSSDKKNTGKVGKAVINNLTFREIKDIIKNSMPNVTIGTGMSNIKSFSANSTTSNDIANVILISEQSNKSSVGTGHKTLAALDQMNDMLVVPSVGSISSVGMPLIQRGQQFFIDAKTGTTIDAIYTVQSVSHTIGEGGFDTKIDVIYTGENRVESLRQKLEDIVDDIV